MYGFEHMVQWIVGEMDWSESRDFEWLELEAYADRGFGWSAGRFTAPGLHGRQTFRYTGVWRLEHGVWRCIQHHSSLGIPNMDAFGHDITINEEFSVGRRDSTSLHPIADQNGWVTLMFTDIEDSTRLNNRLGDEVWISFLQSHDDVVRRAVNASGGLAVKHQGDGFMLGFPSPNSALTAAMQIRDELPASVRGERLRIRAGIHCGPTHVTEDDFFGATVAYAARVASAARGGEILLSDEAVKHFADGTAQWDAIDAELKGFPGPQRIWRANPAG